MVSIRSIFILTVLILFSIFSIGGHNWFKVKSLLSPKANDRVRPHFVWSVICQASARAFACCRRSPSFLLLLLALVAVPLFSHSTVTLPHRLLFVSPALLSLCQIAAFQSFLLAASYLFSASSAPPIPLSAFAVAASFQPWSPLDALLGRAPLHIQ